MTIDEAIKILDSAAAQFQGNRQDHIMLQQAMELVKKEVKKEVEEDKTEE